MGTMKTSGTVTIELYVYKKERSPNRKKRLKYNRLIIGIVLESTLCIKNVHTSIKTRIDRISSSREVKKEIVMRADRADRTVSMLRSRYLINYLAKKNYWKYCNRIIR